MPRDFWLNLPVKDIKRSKDFFTSLGFEFSGGPGNTENSAPLIGGSKGAMIMLFEEKTFKGFVNTEIADTKKQCEVLLSLEAATKEEVDEMAAKAVAAGG